MATQEPNVYAGLSVAIGGLMYARPKFFAKVMGELLFWVGEDKMTFGSDYSIWEPKWQVEGFVDWDYPDEEQFSDYPRVNVNTKKKILGLNAARLYGMEVPAGLRARGRTTGTPGRPGRRQARRGRRCTGVTDAAAGAGRPRRGARPRARRTGDLVGLRGVVHRLGGRRGDRPPAAADVLLRAELRLPHGRRRLRRRERGRGRAAGRRGPGGPLRVRHDQRRRRRPLGLRAVLRGRGGGRARRAAGRLPAQGRAGGHGPGVPAAARGRRHDGRARRGSPWGRRPRHRTGSGCAAGGPSWACPAGTTRRCWWTPRPARPSAPRCCRCTWRARA